MLLHEGLDLDTPKVLVVFGAMVAGLRSRSHSQKVQQRPCDIQASRAELAQLRPGHTRVHDPHEDVVRRCGQLQVPADQRKRIGNVAANQAFSDVDRDSGVRLIDRPLAGNLRLADHDFGRRKPLCAAPFSCEHGLMVDACNLIEGFGLGAPVIGDSCCGHRGYRQGDTVTRMKCQPWRERLRRSRLKLQTVRVPRAGL